MAWAASAEEPGVKVLREEPLPQGRRVILSIDSPGMALTRGPDGRVYTKLALRGAALENEFGQPALPGVHYTGEVPAGMKVSVAIAERQPRELKVAHPLWPHQPPASKRAGAKLRQPFQVEAEAYAGAKSKGFAKAWNGQWKITQYRKRGKDYVDVIARPFGYRAQDGVVRHPAELVVDLTFTAADLPKAGGPRTGPIVVLELEIKGRADLERLTREGYNFERRSGNRVHIYATEAEAQALRDAGFAVKEIERQPQASKIVPQSLKGVGSYHTYASLTTELQDYSARFPNLCRLSSIGQSVQGRELWAMKITTDPDQENGKPRVRLGSTLHGDEPLGTEMCFYLIDLLLEGSQTNSRLANLVAATEVWVLPLLNPDGFEAHTRFNADGYDLNRSFPDGGGGGLGNPVFGPPVSVAGRPPEVANIMQFSLAHNFTLAVNFHGGALVVNYPYDNDSLGAVDSPTPDDGLFEAVSLAYSSNNPAMWTGGTFSRGIVNGAFWYVVNGGMQDWHYRYAGCNEVTIELSDNTSPAASMLGQYWNDNREAMLSFIETVQGGVHGRITDALSGQPVRAAMKPLGVDHPVFADPGAGYYHRMLLPGTYDLLFTAPGYAITVISNVVVGGNQSVEVDAQLQPLASQPDRIVFVTCESLRGGLPALTAEKQAEGFWVQELVVPNGTPAERIRARVRDVYSSYPAEYIILAGDREQIAPFDDGHATDLPYGLMDTGEGLPDFLGKDAVVGRISLKTVEALGQFSQKLGVFVAGRSNPLHDLTWISHGYDSAEYDQAERAHEWCITNAVLESYNHARFYRGIGSAAELSAHINAGTDGVIYSGHGDVTLWVRYDYDVPALSALANLEHVPIVIGHSCLTGSFDQDVCLAEAWLQTTARGVAYVGASADTYWDEDEMLQMAEFEAMKYTQGMSIGSALEQGLYQVYLSSPATGQYYHTIYHVLGDPTLVMIDTAAYPLAIRTAPELPTANAGAPYSLTLRASGGTPPYSWSVIAGELPAGLTLIAASGKIGGTPTMPGTNQFTIQVQDASVSPQVATLACTLGVSDPSEPLNAAIDVVNWFWRVGASPWFSQTVISHDGVDAAQSGQVFADQQSWMETTLNGPGILTFWWKVSSEPDYDFLEFYLNGQRPPDRISGEVDWRQQTIALQDGPQTVRWVYSKDFNISEGQDCGWLDQVQFTATLAPAIVGQPASQTVVVGDTASFRVTAVGLSPLTYRWFRDGVAISGAGGSRYDLLNAQLDRAGAYHVEISNTYGSVTSAPANLTMIIGLSLAEALDVTNSLTINSAATYPWRGQTAIAHDGIDAGQSENITHEQASEMAALVTGPGLVRFWWRVSSEPGYDFLDLFINGDKQPGGISGEVDWQARSVSVGAGLQTLRWVYSKDRSESYGSDCGWVDQLSFEPAVSAPQIIETQVAQNQVRFRFATVSGATYFIEYKDGLEQPAWQTLRSVTGDGNLSAFTNACTTPVTRFYRLRVLPAKAAK